MKDDKISIQVHDWSKMLCAKEMCANKYNEDTKICYENIASTSIYSCQMVLCYIYVIMLELIYICTILSKSENTTLQYFIFVTKYWTKGITKKK